MELELTEWEQKAGTKDVLSRRVFDQVQAAERDATSDQFTQVIDFARRYFERHGLNHMDAEDLAMKACLRLWTRGPQLGPICTAWLQRVAHHLLIDHHRQQERERRWLEFYAVDLEIFAEEHREAVAMCTETLEAMAPADRELLFSHYVEGFKVKELAGRLNLSVACVKQRLHRAREHLHARLTRHATYRPDDGV